MCDDELSPALPAPSWPRAFLELWSSPCPLRLFNFRAWLIFTIESTQLRTMSTRKRKQEAEEEEELQELPEDESEE